MFTSGTPASAVNNSIRGQKQTSAVCVGLNYVKRRKQRDGGQERRAEEERRLAASISGEVNLNFQKLLSEQKV